MRRSRRGSRNRSCNECGVRTISRPLGWCAFGYVAGRAHQVIKRRRKPAPDLSSLGDKLVYGGDCELIAELTKGSRQQLGALFLFPRAYFAALLDESHPFMQDLPNDATEPICNGPDGGLIAEAGHQTAEHNLKMTAFLGD